MENILDEIERLVATGELTAEQRRPLFWAIRTARQTAHEDEREREWEERNPLADNFGDDDF
jgi:hypothetical protein